MTIRDPKGRLDRLRAELQLQAAKALVAKVDAEGPRCPAHVRELAEGALEMAERAAKRLAARRTNNSPTEGGST